MSTPPHSHDLDEVATIPVLRGPGEQLRSAREAAGTSVHEISTHMHLDSRIILALEADDYDQLPAPTFVRGYLRGYARLLDLDPEPIIRAFEQRDFAPPSLVADISVKSRVHGGDFPIRLATYIVIAALIVLVILWWRSQDFAPVRFDAPFAGDSALPEEESAFVPQEAPEPQAAAPQEEIATPVEAEASPETREPAAVALEPDAQALVSVGSETESESPEETEAPVAETLALAAESGIAAGEDGSAEALGALDEAAAFALPAEGEAEPSQDLSSGEAESAAPGVARGESSAPEANAEAPPAETSTESPDPGAVPETTEVSAAPAPASSATGGRRFVRLARSHRPPPTELHRRVLAGGLRPRRRAPVLRTGSARRTVEPERPGADPGGARQFRWRGGALQRHARRLRFVRDAGSGPVQRRRKSSGGDPYPVPRCRRRERYAVSRRGRAGTTAGARRRARACRRMTAGTRRPTR